MSGSILRKSRKRKSPLPNGHKLSTRRRPSASSRPIWYAQLTFGFLFSLHFHTNRRFQADNQDINNKLKEQLAKERAKAAIKVARGDKGKKRSAEDSGGAAVAESSNVDSSIVSSSAEEVPEPERKKSKKSKGGKDKSEKKSRKDKKN